MTLEILILNLLVTAATPSSGSADAPRPAPGQTAVFVDQGLLEPFAVDFDASGRAYIAEMSANRVSVVGGEGRPSVLAGTGEKGLSGDGGPARAARFDGPHHLLVGPDGALYVADTFNNCVRRIDLATGVITRFAGTGEKGYSGDGGPAAAARFSSVFNIAFRGKVLYVADLVVCNVDFGTIMVHHHACAPKSPSALQLKTERYSRLEFARAAAELMRRVAPGWS